MDTENKDRLEINHLEPGAPMTTGGIPLSIPEIRGNEWKYIKECLDTNWVSSVGAFVERFERSVAGYVGTRHGVSAVNGTAALHVALLVADIQPDDEVLVSTLTFIAPVNAIRYVGAWPVFIDADPAYWQMDPALVVSFLEDECVWVNHELRNKTTKRRVRGILPVHILGHPVDLDPILEIARKYDLVVIEDASEALGTRYKGRMAGALGDIACFSFNGNKLITTGGGGMVVTDNDTIARKAKYLTTQAKDDPLEYVHNEIGFNYRLTNILAAMGVAQMEQLDDFIATKHQIAGRYQQGLGDIPGITLIPQAPWAASTFWLYTILVDEAVSPLNSRAILQKLGAEGIQTRPLWTPIHMSPAHKNAVAVGGGNAEALHQKSLSLPCSVGLSQSDQDVVISYLRDWLLSS
jgi:perosamine synthetase